MQEDVEVAIVYEQRRHRDFERFQVLPFTYVGNFSFVTVVSLCFPPIAIIGSVMSGSYLGV